MSGEFHVLSKDDADPKGTIKNFMTEEIQTYIKVAGLIDLNLEIERLKKKQDQLSKLKEGLLKKIQIPNYEQKVPEHVRNENSTKLNNYEIEIAAIEKSLGELKALL